MRKLKEETNGDEKQASKKMGAPVRKRKMTKRSKAGWAEGEEEEGRIMGIGLRRRMKNKRKEGRGRKGIKEEEYNDGEKKGENEGG